MVKVVVGFACEAVCSSLVLMFVTAFGLDGPQQNFARFASGNEHSTEAVKMSKQRFK